MGPQSLRKGGREGANNFLGALLAVPRNTRMMFVHAVQVAPGDAWSGPSCCEGIGWVFVHAVQFWCRHHPMHRTRYQRKTSCVLVQNIQDLSASPWSGSVSRVGFDCCL